MVHHISESSFVVDLKSTQSVDPILMDLNESVLNKSVEAFSQRGDGVLRYQVRLCVPDVGATKMYHDLREVYWWNCMKKDITGFMAKCTKFQQVKAEHQRPGVDRMTKSAHFFPVKTSFTMEDYYAKLYINEIRKLHGVPSSIISDRGTQFTSYFGKAFQKGLGTNVKLKRLKTSQSRQKSYADLIKRDLYFEIGDWVYLKISPMKCVMRFGKKGKLRPRYMGLYQILKHIGKGAYELDLANKLAPVHPVFHVAILKRCIGDPVSIIPLEGLGVNESLSYEEVPLEGWFELSAFTLIGPELVYEAMDKVQLILEMFKTTQSGKKSFTDFSRRELEFNVYDWV
ncbi:hypothetical protein MTR67_012281 [Solanum verrucosum]|uniref:Uncharacterized protein n=1 Tax=Solanum verrucosum TaxID=315347 RepID=A0AAF0QE74_SOLVR|nr:hypothetical protein MTR67_012281 [Solanum verrucosum]